MAYTDVISLTEAKNYLRIEHSDEDGEITAMIGAACAYVEKRCGHLFYSRNKTYPLVGRDSIRVFDFPITAIVKGFDKSGNDVALTNDVNITVQKGCLNTTYSVIDPDADELVLTVGYENSYDVPSGLIAAAKIILKQLYYQTDEEAAKGLNSSQANILIQQYERFMI